MRVVFCGSGEFAIPSFRAICGGGHELVGVLTQPPRRAGRGGKLRATPIAIAADESSVEATPCENINSDDTVAMLKALRPDVIAVVDFGQVIRAAARDCAALDTINLHGSLLPALRGAAPVNWAIIRGHEITGVTTFSLVDEVDAGAIIAQTQTYIDLSETAEELKSRLADMGADLMCHTLDLLAEGRARRTEQDHSQATYTPLMKKSDGVIDWSADAETVNHLVHGTWPWPGGQAVLKRSDGKEIAVVIARAEVLPGPVTVAPGTVDDELCVATGHRRVRILELKPAGKRLMAFSDFANGYRLSAGDRFLWSK
ncbi:MAG: methionyl-tRNA formyltransferase [Phycisphaerae bacterium]|jgi:methionyl-tRNA formyltransferase|nr:methionyl-tRNA formyltransferase [Phycisphaerae bacterium]